MRYREICENEEELPVAHKTDTARPKITFRAIQKLRQSKEQLSTYKQEYEQFVKIMYGSI